MAKKTVTTTEFIDDLDGGTATGTVAFSYNGVNYEIDLSKKNKTAMDRAFKPYVDHARKAKTARTRRAPGRPAARRSDLSAIREWAKSQGLDVSDRGRISQDVQDQYDAAH